jgi:CBS domain containing-hemolysin-like protein
MTLLLVFVLIALVFSFLCSIAEAVLLSVTPAYVALLEREGKPAASILRSLRAQIHRPLAAILTLNTIAHTVGAAGAGAQAAVVFGSAYLGIASAILTLLILVFSEIIPKTMGARHWRRLASGTAYGLRLLVWLLYPFVLLSEKITGGTVEGNTLSGFSRSEFAAMAELSAEEGQLAKRESEILKNLMALRQIRVHDAMTPRTVMFSLPGATTVEEFFHKYDHVRFSRIPVFGEDPDKVDGFVLRGDMLLAQARGNSHKQLMMYRRDMPAIPETISLARAFNHLMQVESHIALVVDEYGDLQGLLTLEDILETLLGLEIVDEGDESIDMQDLARRQWRKRARKMGIENQDFTGNLPDE